MKRFLRSIMNWMDKKFPDKVVITRAEYDAVKAKADKVDAIEGEIKAIHTALNSINLAMGIVPLTRPPINLSR